MNINRNNYEIYFLDYRENQLPAEDVADLMLFLEQNPDLKSEFEDFENISLIPEEMITFESKEGLKKQPVTEVNGINTGNYEEYFIASVEKDLNPDEETNLVLFLQSNTFLQKEFELFKLSTITPDKSVIYNNKSGLYKKAVVFYLKPVLYYAASAAAIILLFFSIYMNIDFSEEKGNILAQLDQGSTIVEDSLVTKKAEAKEQTISPSREDSNSGIETIINRNPDTKRRSVSPLKRKPEIKDGDLKQIKKIKITSVDFVDRPSISAITEVRDEVYFVFRNFYADNNQLASINPEQNENQSVLANIFSRIKSAFQKDRTSEDQPGNTFWDIADAGISGFNRITGNDLRLNREYGSDGKIKALAFKSESFEISRKKPTK